MQDLCRPWDCLAANYFPPRDGLLPNDVIVKTYAGKVDSM